jgi:hypothetical protein
MTYNEHMLIEALETLMAEQNGAPLISTRMDWELAMRKAQYAIDLIKKPPMVEAVEGVK